ncbi:DUF4395 domain-containing protein [Homoserinibacter sp. YIM 151385]|uniref:DUF4395 domain-containing protein n=1 Tax=Homoserinibacter sp. YIM 151385 TaxID=2985506 RepID=UPI0022F10957|nr:DUF4395 domain-containing protein [Homoserinibacter sp. YIM 151385]WBU38908.1 DUF4395 domain-containing protein [Homoserinibacter sp. YIM 151385]
MTEDRTPAGIDPRGPRFGAAVTAVLALAVVGLATAGALVAAVSVLAVLAAAFAAGALGGVQRNPFGILYRVLVQPRLASPAEREDPRPPTFAQRLGLGITLAGILGALLAPAPASIAAGSLVFLAAFLNAVFGLCVGCRIHLIISRVRRGVTAA